MAGKIPSLSGFRTWFLLGLLCMLGTSIVSGADAISVRDSGACSASSTCDGPNSTADEKSADDCLSDAEGGLCASDPEAMFERCSPDRYCLNRDNFGAVAIVDASVFRDAPSAEDCRDFDEDCEYLAVNDATCLINPGFMQSDCPKSCYHCIENYDGRDFVEFPIGVKQKMPSKIRDEAKKKVFYDVIAETASYMANEVFAKAEFQDSRKDCQNTESQCSWMVASTGGSYCDNLSAQLACGPACKACGEMLFSDEQLDVIANCTPNYERNAFVNALDEDGNKVDDDDLQTIDTMFRRIVGELPYPSSPEEEYPIIPGVNYTAKVLSRPSLNPKIHTNMPFGSIDFHIGGPWIVVLDDFLTPEECDRMIELGDLIGRERSTIEDDDEYDDDEYEDDTEQDKDATNGTEETKETTNEDGEKEYEDDTEQDEDATNGTEETNETTNEDGEKEYEDDTEQDKDATNETEETKEDTEEDGEDVSAWRTSSTAWCQEDCVDDPIAKRIQRRIGLTTGVTDDAYYEELQLLKYVEGQYYMEHHDESGDVHEIKFSPDGPRILTFFLYLNDVEEGGETRFSDLMGDSSKIHLDVEPKKGRALLWPSMLNEDNLAYDVRTFHAALAVKKGLKYGANAWLHLRDVRNSNCDEGEIEDLMGKLSTLME